MGGLQAIQAIRRVDASVRIVAFTMYQGDEDVYRALEAGAATYLLKDDGPSTTFPALPGDGPQSTIA